MFKTNICKRYMAINIRKAKSQTTFTLREIKSYNKDIMLVSEWIFVRKAKFMYKVSKGFTPEYINVMFSKRQDDRNANDLHSMTVDNHCNAIPSSLGTQTYGVELGLIDSVSGLCDTVGIMSSVIYCSDYSNPQGLFAITFQYSYPLIPFRYCIEGH